MRQHAQYARRTLAAHACTHARGAQLRDALLPLWSEAMFSSWQFPQVWNVDYGAGEPYFFWASIYPLGPYCAGLLPDRPVPGEPCAGALVYASVPAKAAARFKSTFDDMLAAAAMQRIPTDAL